MTGSFLLVPHRQDVCLYGMAWDSSQIAGEISIFWNFYIFVGCCLTSQSHSDGKCRSTFDVFDALATSPDDYLDLDLVEKLKTPQYSV